MEGSGQTSISVSTMSRNSDRTSRRAGGGGGSARSPGRVASARSSPSATSGSSSAIRGESAQRLSVLRSAGGRTPARAASNGSQSRNSRVIGPGWSKVGASGTIPRIDRSPLVGLIVDVPHSADGMRSDPAVSVPVVAGT